MPEINEDDALILTREYYEKQFGFNSAVKIVTILAKVDIAGLLQYVYRQAVIDKEVTNG